MISCRQKLFHVAKNVFHVAKSEFHVAENNFMPEKKSTFRMLCPPPRRFKSLEVKL